MKKACYVKSKMSVGAGRVVVLLAAAFMMTLAGVAEIVLEGTTTVTGYTTYKSDTILTGTGGFLVKDGGTLRFNEKATFANTFSGGVVIEEGGILEARQWDTRGTPFGAGPIELQCTGAKPTYIQFARFAVPQTVTTTGNSSMAYPAFRTVYSGTTFKGVVVGGDLYMDATYADEKDNSMNSIVFDFTEGLNAGSYDVGASIHARIRFQDKLTCGRLVGCYGVGTAASTLNGRLGGFVLAAAGNEIGAIVLDGQYVRCDVSGALNGASLRFEGQHPCIGPEGYTSYETGIVMLNATSSGTFTQTLKWIESDSRARSIAAGYGIRTGSSAGMSTLAISGEAGKTATAYANVNGKVNMVLAQGAPETFRQVFMDRESTMTGTIAVNGGTLEVGGEATFAGVPSLSVVDGAVVVSSSLPAFAGLTALTVGGTGSVTVATGAAIPFPDYTVDVSLGADSQLVLPAGSTLRVRSLTVDGTLQPAREYSHADFAQIVGGTVESAQGATVTEQSITWTAADATDPTDSRKGANWGLAEDPSFGQFEYLPTFAQAGTSAAFYGRNRFVNMTFSAAEGMEAFTLAKGSADADILLTGGVTATGAAKYFIEPPVTFVAANSVSVDEGSMLRFDGGISAGFAVTKAGAGRMEIAGESSLNGTVTVSAGTLMLSGDVNGSGEIRHCPETATKAFVSLSNATVGVKLTQTGGSASMGAGINVPAGTESLVNGYAYFSGSISFHGGGTTILAGGARFINKCYSYDGTVIVSNTPATSQYGGVQAYRNGKWIFMVAGNEFAQMGGDSLLVAYGGDIDLRCDNFMENPETMKWEIDDGTFELNGTRQTAKCIYSGTDSRGNVYSNGVLHGDDGSVLTLSGDTERRVYRGYVNGGVSLRYAGGEGGELALAGRNLASTGSVTVVSGLLSLSNATWKAASSVTVEGGTLSIDQSETFGKDSAALYVKDGMIQLAADTFNHFAEAYLWDEAKGAYVRTGNGVFTAGSSGLSAHLSGAGKIRIGKLGAAFVIR